MLQDESDINPYLQQEVMTASPPRLRWLLIRRSVELCGMVAQMWNAGQHTFARQWLLNVREILGELLDGVKDEKNPLSKPISDFYLFLLQLATEVEQHHDAERLQVLQDLLAIEAETWRQVIEKVGSESVPAPSVFPALPTTSDSFGGSFSLEV